MIVTITTTLLQKFLIAVVCIALSSRLSLKSPLPIPQFKILATVLHTAWLSSAFYYRSNTFQSSLGLSTTTTTTVLKAFKYSVLHILEVLISGGSRGKFGVIGPQTSVAPR